MSWQGIFNRQADLKTIYFSKSSRKPPLPPLLAKEGNEGWLKFQNNHVHYQRRYQRPNRKIWECHSRYSENHWLDAIGKAKQDNKRYKAKHIRQAGIPQPCRECKGQDGIVYH